MRKVCNTCLFYSDSRVCDQDFRMRNPNDSCPNWEECSKHKKGMMSYNFRRSLEGACKSCLRYDTNGGICKRFDIPVNNSICDLWVDNNSFYDEDEDYILLN